MGQTVLCIVSLPLTVLGQKSERKPKRPKKSPRGQGVLEQRFYTAKAQSTRDCGSINISKREESREKTQHSQSSVYKRLWKHQHLQESRKKTLHSEQLQSARDCWSRSISKRGKCQERRFYTAAKAQSTRDCRRVNISKGDKKEDSTQQPKLSLQETAEARTSPKETRKKILHSSQSSVDNRQSSSKHQASRLQQNLNFRH